MGLAALRRDQHSLLPEGRHPNRAVAAQPLRGQRCNQDDGELLGAIHAVADLHRGVEVEHDPEVAGRFLVEFAHHQCVTVRGNTPGNMTQAVARRIMPHTRNA